MAEPIEEGMMVFLSDGGTGVGAVRQLTSDSVVVYIENAGDFSVPLSAITDIHSGKLILDRRRLAPDMQEAIRHIHDAERSDI
jgi:hypothetical protein